MNRVADRTPSNEHVKEFAENVEQEGLPYILKGRIDESAKKVYMQLYLPGWEEEVRRIPEEIRSRAPHNLTRDGEIGFIVLNPHSGKHADTEINRVRSHADWLPKDSKYYGAHVGRFLMNNLLAIADRYGWSIYAFPYTDGRLSNDDVLAWLDRKGFDEYGIRKPQDADAEQPVIEILNELDQRPEQADTPMQANQ